MVDVEAVELAVAHHVDAALLLRVDDHACGVDQRLLRGVGHQPVGDRVRADDGGLDSGHALLRCVNHLVMNHASQRGRDRQCRGVPTLQCLDCRPVGAVH